jgi:5-methylcytosine-specific restriction endonuclease McrA
MDDDVTKKSGIYEYLIDGKEKHLSVRAFTPAQKQAAYERQNGICPKCNEHFDIKDMEGDHITPWSKGGHTTSDNCQMLCKDCNRKKSDV